MARNNLNFVIALKFLTENFNRQATKVKSQLLTLQRNFLSLASAVGVGSIGLTNFVSRLVDTAKKTSQASIALQNVSGNMKAYAENQQWLIGLSKKYGVEVNSLTLGFAKFKAAADISSMSLEDQRKIFESVSRATVAFGLSQEDQRGVFMALSQMMSKNKVMAEELRLQLAERMPVAIQAMAKAAGVTVNELDALMKQGKVLSSEVLPKFADALTEMTPNVNLDNLNKSLVDLSNIFTDLTRKLDVEGKFKSMVDAVAGALRWLVDNTKTAVNLIGEALLSLTAIKIGGSLFKDYQKGVDTAIQAIERKRVAEETAAESAKRAGEAKTAFEKAQAAERTAIANVEAKKTAGEKKTVIREAEAIVRQEHKKTAAAEKALIKANLQATKDAEYAKQQAAKVTAKTTHMAASASATGFTKLGNILTGTLATAISKVGRALKAAFSATIWTAALTALFEIGRRLVNVTTSVKGLKDMLEDAGNVELPQEAKDLDYWQGLLHHKDGEVRAGAMQKINEMLGTQLTTEKEINEEILKRQRYLLAEAKLQQANENLAKVAEERKTTKRPIESQLVGWANNESLYIRQRADALAEMAKYGYKPTATSSTSNISGGGAGTAKIPVISLTIDEDDVAATMEQLQDTIFANEAEAKRKQAFAMQHRGQSILNSTRDTSGDWKLSPTEILEADKIFAQEKVAKLIAFAEETGNDMAVAIQEGIAKAGTLEEAIKASELSNYLKETKEELSGLKMNLFEGTIDNVEGLVSAFGRLNDAIEEDANAWEVLTAMFDIFKSSITAVMETIELLDQIKQASANVASATAAQNVASAQGEAIASGVAGAAKEPMPTWAKIAMIGGIVGAIMSAFAAIPKFAKGGVVGGNSTQGDKVLARLNSGEGVLTAVGMQSLHDASNPANSRNIHVTGVLVGQGRQLKAIIDKEDKYQRLTK